jgi:hypothetical protein
VDSPYGEFGRPVAMIEAYAEWRDLQEADTRADFATWLWGPVRQAVWRGYERIESKWDTFCAIENMNDFRERRLRGLNALQGYGRVGEHGEYPGMTRTDRGGPGLILDTYGGVYSITRHLIINDQSGELLNRNPADMGYAAALFLSEAVVALVESNPVTWDGVPFFDVSRGNLGTAALSEDSLVDAIAAMENQRDDDGRRIIVRPKVMLVQNARMELIAKRILRSSQTGTSAPGAAGVGTGPAVFDKGTDNVVQGILPDGAISREPFLTDATDWYLLADPNVTPAYAVGFLQGRRQPFVGLKDPQVRNALGAGMDPYTFELDSVDFKVRHDFGCATVDPRGAHKNVVAG